MLIAGISMLLQACTSGPKVYGNDNPDASFDTYKTYSYQTYLATDKEAGVRSILSSYLIKAVDRELQGRGYQKVTGEGDLEIQFNVNTQEKITSRSTGTSVSGGYYGYRGRGGYGTSVTYGGGNEISQYTEGTLTIDLVDNKRDVLAWEGVAIGKITDKARENLAGAVDETVRLVFLKFPYTAPGFVPPLPAE